MDKLSTRQENFFDRFHEELDVLSEDAFRLRLQEIKDELSNSPGDAVVIELLEIAHKEPASIRQLSPGLNVGPYLLEKRLGKGGFGEVWLAEENTELIKREVAIKIILPRNLLGPESKTFIARFCEEARHFSRQQHPGIVTLYSSGYDSVSIDGLKMPYLVMEYIQGRIITDACRRHGITEKLDCFIKVCEAVQCLHDVRILHLDLKPENILVIETGDGLRPKLLDFGLAQAFRAASPGACTDYCVGTPPYMAPEQWNPSAKLNFQTDVHALGVLLFQILTDQLPFRPKGPSHIDWKEAICSCNRSKVAEFRDAPLGLQEVVDKALSYEQKDRFSSPNEFVKNLKEVIGTRGPIHKPLSSTTRRATIGTIAAVAFAAGTGSGWRLSSTIGSRIASPAPRLDPPPEYPKKIIFSPVDSGGARSTKDAWESLKKDLKKHIDALLVAEKVAQAEMEVGVSLLPTPGEQLEAFRVGQIQICALGTGATVSAVQDSQYKFRPSIELCYGENQPNTYREPAYYHPVFVVNNSRESERLQTVDDLVNLLDKDNSLRFGFGNKLSNSSYRIPFLVFKRSRRDRPHEWNTSDIEDQSSLIRDVANWEKSDKFAIFAACVASDVYDNASSEDKDKIRELKWPERKAFEDLKGPFPSTVIGIRNDLPIPLQLCIEEVFLTHRWETDTGFKDSYALRGEDKQQDGAKSKLFPTGFSLVTKFILRWRGPRNIKSQIDETEGKQW